MLKRSVLLSLLAVGLLLGACSKGRNQSSLPISQQQAKAVEPWMSEAVVARLELAEERQANTFPRLQARLLDLRAAGFNVAWLSPVFPSSSVSQNPHALDPFPTQDYLAVDSNHGSFEEFRSFVRESHRLGFKVLLDIQIRCTAWDSKILLEHPDWFHTNPDGSILSPSADQPDVAELNLKHHELRKYLINVLKFWVRDGEVDGFAFHDAEFIPLDFLLRARKEVERIRPVVFLGLADKGELHLEVFDATATARKLDFFIESDSSSSIESMLQTESNHFPRNALRLRPTHQISTFPRKRLESEQGKTLDNLRSLLAFVIPGRPVVVYSALDIVSDSVRLRSEKAWYSRLIALRDSSEAMRHGEVQELRLSNSAALRALERRTNTERVLVILNGSSRRQDLSIQLQPGSESSLYDYLASKPLVLRRWQLELQLAPFQAKIIIRSEKGTPS